jgi:hypothetical protein
VRYLRSLSSFSPSCSPYGINDAGVAIGTCAAGNRVLATVWTASGRPDALFINGGSNPVAPGSNQTALALSDSGYVTGLLPNGTGFVFTPSKQLQVLPIPSIPGFAATTDGPVAVNDHGQAVGHASGPNRATCFWRAFAWLSPGKVTNLGFCGSATAISDDATVFADFSDSATGRGTAVVWTAASGLHRLPGLEGGSALLQEQSSVLAVNHRRQALGSITTSTGALHWVIWTLPAP